MASVIPYRSTRGVLATLVGFVCTIAALLLAFTSVADAQRQLTVSDDFPTYTDPRTGIEVARLTSSGPEVNGARCISRIGGGLGNGPASWSADSSRIVYTVACPGPGNASERNGVYVMDIETGAQQCLIATHRGIWASPTFDHADEQIYYIDLRENSGDAPFGIYTVDVPTTVTDGQGCPGIGSRSSVHINLGGRKSNNTERFNIFKNAARQTNGQLDDAWFAVHAEELRPNDPNNRGTHTLIFNADREFLPGWGPDLGSNPLQWSRFSDGDSSIWSKSDPLQIFTNRGDGSGNAITAVWNIEDTDSPLFTPFASVPSTGGNRTSCEGNPQVAHSEWVFHPGSGTEVFIGAGDTRCVWTRTRNGTVRIDSIELAGYLHLNASLGSVGGALDDIEFVSDTYHVGGGKPLLHRLTIGDMRPGGNNSWSTVISDSSNELVWHRNNLMDGAELTNYAISEGFTNADDRRGFLSGFKPLEPHPQYSPDGRFVIWQSSSQTSDLDHPSAGDRFACAEAECGADGGFNRPWGGSGTLYTDLYLVDLNPDGPPDPTPTPTPQPTPVPGAGVVLNELDDADDWSSWATRGEFDGAVVTTDGITFNYTVQDTGYVAARLTTLPVSDWRESDRLEIGYVGQGTGGEVLVLIRQGTVSQRLNATFRDDGVGPQTVTIALSEFGAASALSNISEIAIEFDETSPNPFVLTDLRLRAAVQPTSTPTATPVVPTATPIPPPGASVVVNRLNDAGDWGSWSDSGSSFGGATVQSDGVAFDYTVNGTGYVGVWTKNLEIADWRAFGSLELEYEADGGGPFDVLIRRGSENDRPRVTVAGGVAGGVRTVSIPLADFVDVDTMANITQVVFEFDETSPRSFTVRDFRLVSPAEAATDIVTLAGRTDGWVRVNGTRNWVGAACRSQLIDEGLVLNEVSWPTLAQLTDASPFQRCDALIAELLADGQVRLITMIGRSDAWVSVDGTRNWVGATCRARLMAEGLVLREVSWPTLAELVDASPFQRCDALIAGLN